MDMNLTRRKFVGGMGAAALAVASSAALAACSSSSSASSSSSESDAEAAKETMKVSLAAQANSGQVFQYIADAHGYLTEEAIEVEMQYIASPSDAFQALSSKKVDILSTYGTGGPMVQISQGQPFTIFGGYMIIGETPIFGKPETEYKDLNSLVGKKLGIGRLGTADCAMRGILLEAGLLDQVEFVEFKKYTDAMQACVNGEVDFVGTATGYELQAADLGLEVKIWPDELWPDHSCCRMLARDEFVSDEKSAEALYRLLRAYIRAEEYMQDHKDEVVDLVVSNLDLDRATVESFVMSPHMKYDTNPDKQACLKMWDVLEKCEYVDPNCGINPEDHINTEIYKKAIESLVAEYPDSQFMKDKLAAFEAKNA